MDTNELLEWMNDDMRARWEDAIAHGGDTWDHFGAPDCGCDGHWMPEYDSGWMQQWVGTCFDVIEGKIHVFDWVCTDYGDWEYEPRCVLEDLPDDSFDDLLTESLQASIDYAEWCLENHDDPLGEYLVNAHRTRKERWQVRFVSTCAGIRLDQARRAGKVYDNAFDLPHHVRRYMHVKSADDCTSANTTLTQETLDEVGIRCGAWHTVTLEHKVERSKAAYWRDLRKVIRRGLKHTRAALARWTQRLPENCEIECPHEDDDASEDASKTFRLWFYGESEPYVSEEYWTDRGESVEHRALAICRAYGWLDNPPNSNGKGGK